jgi:hypothetical protein
MAVSELESWELPDSIPSQNVHCAYHKIQIKIQIEYLKNQIETYIYFNFLFIRFKAGVNVILKKNLLF